MPKPNDEDTAKRAYEIYLQRGSLPGYEVNDWLQAEAELTASAARGLGKDESEEPATGEARGTAARRGGARRDATGPSRRTLRQ